MIAAVFFDGAAERGELAAGVGEDTASNGRADETVHALAHAPAEAPVPQRTRQLADRPVSAAWTASGEQLAHVGQGFLIVLNDLAVIGSLGLPRLGGIGRG